MPKSHISQSQSPKNTGEPEHTSTAASLGRK